MRSLLEKNTRLVDRLGAGFESKATLGRVSLLLLFIYVSAILIVDLKIRGVIGPDIGRSIPGRHLAAIELVFTILLVYEAMGLLFSISDSISVSVGKQFEILSLILLRNTFKLVSHFPEPLTWEGVDGYVMEMGTSISAALVIFFLTQVFYRVSRRNRPAGDDMDLQGFIHAKKLTTTLMLAGFLVIIVSNLLGMLLRGERENIFGEFYTLLIFFDILMVIISLRYHSGYNISFRNSAYAVSTVIIKIALIAPAVYSAAISIFATLVAIAAAWVFCRFKPDPEPRVDP